MPPRRKITTRTSRLELPPRASAILGKNCAAASAAANGRARSKNPRLESDAYSGQATSWLRSDTLSLLPSCCSIDLVARARGRERNGLSDDGPVVDAQRVHEVLDGLHVLASHRAAGQDAVDPLRQLRVRDVAEEA